MRVHSDHWADETAVNCPFGRGRFWLSLHPLRRILPQVAFLVALGLFLSGCIIPYPARTTTRVGITGKVVDGSDGRPIVGAKVTVTYAGEPYFNQTIGLETLTGPKGSFEFRREYLQHWFYIFAVALNHHWPHPDCFAGPYLPVAVTVEHPNYEVLTYQFHRRQTGMIPPDRPIMEPVPEDRRTYRLILEKSTE